MVSSEIAPDTLKRFQQALLDWMNAWNDVQMDSLDGWQVYPVDEFLIFGSPGGYTNRLYLVGDGVIHPFSYSDETQEYALAAARAERDGTEPPPPPGPAITAEEWNKLIGE